MTRLRALVILAILMAGSFAASAPPAVAQETPTIICLNGDCTGAPPPLMQGDAVDITVPSFPGGQPYMSVRCIGGCPAGDPSASEVYWVVYRGATVQFPRDFTDPGPENDGGNAVRDKVPRYNSTWEVRLHLTTTIQRQFGVWLYDAHEDTNSTVRPGATHTLRATGFDPGADVAFRWERRDPLSGRYEPFAAPNGRAYASGAQSGWFVHTFQLPKSEGSRIAECGAATLDCYRIVISGAGKQEEVVNVQVGLADVARSTDTTPRQSPANVPLLQRTMNVTFDVDLYYPSGHLRNGPKLLPTDVHDSITFGGKALRVAVEKVYRGNQTTYLLDQVPLRYDPQRFVWSAQWTIPKDLPIETSGPRYQLRLLEQRDVYGNRIVEDNLGNFTVESAGIKPRVLETFPQLERTEEGILRLGVLYHNGTSFTLEDAIVGNVTPLVGCFVRLPDAPPEPAPPAQPQINSCAGHPKTLGTYYDGAWNFTMRYPREYPELTGHRFILDNVTEDRWGNRFFGTVGAPFNVVPAKPRVEFSTVMRGEDSELLERGNRVFVSATITYHDGSPYNHVVRENPNSTESTILTGKLLRRGPASGGGTYGPLAGEEPFNLTESDFHAGRWSGYLQLTDDDTSTPVGIWTFQFDVADNLTVPNANSTSFDREVVSSLIQICPTFHPSGRAPTGSTVKFRFKLFYSDCAGREVPAAALEGKVTARVYPFNPFTQRPFPDPVSNIIVPLYQPHANQDWSIEYEIPNSLFTGAYTIVVTGEDTYGNRIVPNARSRPFSTYTEVLTRAVITQPAAEVRRGDSATVVFDAREGDTGVDPRLMPRVQLERFDTSTTECPAGPSEGGCWVREIGDVRASDPSFSDHVGVFPVGVDTPVGLYRFSLQGRDASFQIITGVSGNFTVNPTQVTRQLHTLPPQAVVKGEAFSFQVEHMAGDNVRDRAVFYNGRPMTMPLPLANFNMGQLNVTWAVPFDAPTGNYTLRLSGRDVNGNVIVVITPPIEALAASLEGRLLGQPTRAVERGDEARLLFGISYPDGQFYAAQDAPRVFVRNEAGAIAQATVRREGLTFAAFWVPAPDTPLGEYTFEVSQQATGGTGNSFPPLRSQPFRVVPGDVIRNPIDDLTAELERLASAAYTVPLEADDKFVGFELVFYGTSLIPAVSDTPLTEVTRSPLPHTLDTASGKYVTRLVTDTTTQVGTFRIEMTGEDAEGNRLFSQSRPFVIRPTTIGIIFDTPPPLSAFGEGKTITVSFTARYSGGTLMDETYGRPSATVLFNNRPVTQRPEMEFRNGIWFLSWTAPPILPDGEYTFLVGGTDLHGNPIATARTTSYPVQTEIGESFAKSIPGPSPALLTLALAAAAALLMRRKRR